MSASAERPSRLLLFTSLILTVCAGQSSGGAVPAAGADIPVAVEVPVFTVAGDWVREAVLARGSKTITVNTVTDRELLWMSVWHEEVVTDGTRVGGLYDDVWSMVAAPVGKSFAFCAGKGEKAIVVKDGARMGGRYEGAHDLVFSPDGRSLAFVASRGGGEMAIRDGVQVGGMYDDVDELVFSPDSRSLAFVATVGEESFVVKDGTRVGGGYDHARGLVFSTRTGALAFYAGTEDAGFIVKDGVRVGGEHWDVGFPVFAPDGRTLWFWVESEEGRFLTKEGTPVGEPCEIPWRCSFVGPDRRCHPKFSSDGRTVAYVGRSEGRDFLVKGGVKVGESYPYVSTAFALSPDGRSCAFYASAAEKWFLVKDGVRIGGEFEGPDGPPLLGPDLQSVAYVTTEGMYPEEMYSLHRDGVVLGSGYAEVLQMLFAPDGSLLAMVAGEKHRGRRFLTRNGARVSKEYYVVSDAQVSADGRMLVFAGTRGKTVYRVEYPWAASE